MTDRRSSLLLFGVAAALGMAGTARGQSFQEGFSSTAPGSPTATAVVPFAPNNPSASVNLANPTIAGVFNPATNASSTILSSGSAVATLSSTAGSQAVTLQIPSLGLTQVFSGANRAANYAQALYYAEQRAPTLFVTNAYTRPTNPSNPGVGNPFSLVPQMVGRDFRIATGVGEFDPSLPRGGNAARIPSVITAGGEINYGSVQGTQLYSITVPVDYRYFFEDPRYSLTVDMPLTFLRIGNANVELGSVGGTFRFPLIKNWSLGVGARFGAVASDLLRVGDTAYSTMLSSQYKLYLGDYKVTIGNSIGYVKTTGFRVGGADTGPALDNYPIANGLSVEGALPFPLLGKPASYEAYLADTYYAGRPIAINHYDEIGLNIGTRGVLGEQSWNQARFGIAYTVGKSFNAVSLRFSYRF